MATKPNRHPRDLGGSFQIHNPDDGTPIREMFTLGERLLMISDKCIYAIKLADQIDPERTNAALPHNIQQKLFDHGADSELVCRSFLQAWRLFRKEFQTIDNDAALAESFAVLGELVAMRSVADEFQAIQKAAIEKATNAGRDQSLAIPAVGNVRAHCKTFAQKADHCAVALSSIVRMFYPTIKKGNWDGFRTLVKDNYGEDDEFSKMMEKATPFLKLVRNTRDCLDHHNVSGVVTHDFELHADGQIGLPSIEVNFRGSTLPRCSIADFFERVRENLLNVFETTVVHMCAKNMKSFAGMPMTIVPLSDEYKKAWRVRFAYGAFYADGQFAPCG
jgi:hypothetical protein